MFPFNPWTPSPGPLYTLLTKSYDTLNLPGVKPEYKSWVSGESPFSTQKAVVAAIGTYLLIIFGGREIMR
jgi:fatty acid elongase 3